MRVEIVFARLAPSRKANLWCACLMPLATKPSAQLYGGLVMMLLADRDVFRKSWPVSP